jgi:hypothetical protein
MRKETWFIRATKNAQVGNVIFYKPSQAMLSLNQPSQNFTMKRCYEVSTLALFVALEILKKHMDNEPERVFIFFMSAVLNNPIQVSVHYATVLHALGHEQCTVTLGENSTLFSIQQSLQVCQSTVDRSLLNPASRGGKP